MNPSFAPSGAIAGSVLPIRRAEELIATLPGVLSVRIVPSDAGAIDEVHVLTTDAVAPKQTVRNIESALIAQLGLRVNHRKISIATTLDPNRANDVPSAAKSPTTVFIPPAPTAVAASAGASSGPVIGTSAAQVFAAAPSSGGAVSGGAVSGGAASAAAMSQAAMSPAAPSPASPRAVESLVESSREPGSAARRVLVFEDVELRRSRERGLTCRVTLSQGERAFAGEAKGQSSERSRIDLAARATVLAIVEALGPTSVRARALTLEGSQLVDAFDREFVFVSIAARDGRDTVLLTGSCEVEESAETSSVLAVLNATNRWMQLDR